MPSIKPSEVMPPTGGSDVPEFEVTPEMIEAGVSVLCAVDTTFESEAEWVKRIYRAMVAARAPLDERGSRP